MTISLAALGEAELLRRLARFAPPGQLDDDTAALQGDSRRILVNTDSLVENIHFSDATTTASDVGWKAVAANLSDLAASGAVQIDGITVALIAPGGTPWNWVDGVYQGMAAALEQHGGTLLGGDCSAGAQRVITVTALGRQGPLRLHRGQAQPGDLLVTSGCHGLSRLGLALLQAEPGIDSSNLPIALKQQAIAQHQRPTPHLKALDCLLNCKPAELPWRAGGTDSSDGLLAAVQAICTSSSCGALLDRTALPRPKHWPQGSRWDQWCLCGGEDYELVLSLPPSWAERWLERRPNSVRIGRTTNEAGTILWSDDRSPIDAVGFDHYRKP
jgi:thiamine-monophosphate kinase